MILNLTLITKRAIFNFFWIGLLPLAVLWAVFALLRRRIFPKRLKYVSSIPIICVGNLHSGGSGKTPLVMELANGLAKRRPIVFSRGYRGTQSKKGGCVELRQRLGAKLFGDEPWMMAHRISAPVYIGSNRLNLVQQAEKNGTFGVIILDDGFQHLKIDKTVDLLVINTHFSLKNSFCLPFGKLREPLNAISNATAILLNMGVQDSSEEWIEFLKEQFPKIPIFKLKRKSEGLIGFEGKRELEGGQTIACFCSVAEPLGFLEEVAYYGTPVLIKEYPDHHDYSLSDVRWIIRECHRKDLQVLVTTDKDWFKVRSLFQGEGKEVLSVRIGYDLPPAFWQHLEAWLH